MDTDQQRKCEEAGIGADNDSVGLGAEEGAAGLVATIDLYPPLAGKGTQCDLPQEFLNVLAMRTEKQ